MARGSFHGGGFHSGGFHSSGGGFRGGGFSGGGGFHSSGRHHYYGGGSGDGYGSLIFFLGSIFVFTLLYCSDGIVFGINYVNAAIFFVSGLILYIVWYQYPRTEVISEIKRDCHHRVMGCAWHGSPPKHMKDSDQKSWAGVYNKYRIVFYDKEFGEDNVLKVRELIDRTPKIVWVNPILWNVIGILSFASTIFFYEVVIPIFENSVMSDAAFNFFDVMVFYFPSLVCALSATASLIIMCVKDNLLYECAIRIVQDNKLAENKIRTETMIADKLSEKWYYNVCPNCGANADFSNRFCNSCGSSLEVRSFGGSYSGFHRVSVKDKEK